MLFKDFKGKVVHFVGIGGVSMSGVAKCFYEHGVVVQGSDSALHESKYIQDFKDINIQLFDSHKEENICSGVVLVIKTSTIKDDNPEIIKARSLNIPVIERYQALELIIATFETRIGISGSSGKTTTAALIWQALCLQEKPSCIIGTILNEVQSSVFINDKSNVCVVEADESDGSFVDMNFNVAVITDIDTDHLDHKRYGGDCNNLIDYFRRFASKALNCGGIVVYNSDCRTTCEVMQEFSPKFSHNIVSYSGIAKVSSMPSYKQGDCYLSSVKNVENGVVFSCGGYVAGEDVFMPMIGKFNAFNSLPGLVLLKRLFGINDTNTFNSFKGIKKRVEVVGSVDNITIIDDYAHSPKKIKTFIESFTSYCRDVDAELVIICEPHKYTRVESLYDEYITCFDGCKNLIMMDIFGIQGGGVNNNISSEKLTNDIQIRWKKIKNHSFYIKCLKNNKDVLQEDTFSFVGEIVHRSQKVFYVFLGAGFSSNYAHTLFNKINK
ncbi:MAG: UDP-N-acetylmuramate--alanine ligase [Candidatus Deianiraeaceae bacterium]|jgi:UDP-N-acetylmuramate--alanine ligase